MFLLARRTAMPRKTYKPEEIVAKLRQVDVLTSQGQGVAEAIRSIGVSEVTYYRWRQEFGGLNRSGNPLGVRGGFSQFAMQWLAGVEFRDRQFPNQVVEVPGITPAAGLHWN